MWRKCRKTCQKKHAGRYNDMQNAVYREIRDEQAEKNMEMAKKYMPYIYEDARSYKSAMERGDYNKAVADAEQMGEKSLKAIAQKNGRLSNTMKQKHGHDLEYLARECGGNIEIPREYLKELSSGYFNARYPEGNKKYNKEEAEKNGKTACKLIDNARTELDIPNSELDKEFGEVNIKTIIDLETWNRLMKEIHG